MYVALAHKLIKWTNVRFSSSLKILELLINKQLKVYGMLSAKILWVTALLLHVRLQLNDQSRSKGVAERIINKLKVKYMCL